MYITADLTFRCGGRTIVFGAGTGCEHMREADLDPIGKRIAKRISKVPRTGMVLVMLGGLGRWIPQEYLSDWRPLRQVWR